MAAELKYTKLVESAVTPIKGSSGAAGYDLAAAFDYYVPGKSVGLINTGLAFEFPPGTYGRVAPRSGLSAKNINVSAGVIDSGKLVIHTFVNLILNKPCLFTDYCGEVMIVLHNHGEADILISKGLRVAQLIIEKIENCVLVCDDTIRQRQSDRQIHGFGSTD